MATNFF